MKLTNIRGFKSIEEYVSHKLSLYESREKSFASLFELMFDDDSNVMYETSDGYKIKKVTYGEAKLQILKTAGCVKQALSNVEIGSMVGIYMQNSPEWLRIFWCVIMLGYRPLLMNTRLADTTLESIISEYSVGAVISDGKRFSVNTVINSELCSESEPYEPAEFGSEVIFMSSGTTDKVKLCAYTGESFYHQIRDSAKVISTCPAIRTHYEGELKHLVLLPFYHVFGFIAVYIWFGFFARTFVFPKDLNPDTVRNTVKKHKVTHIFAVPMVWEAVHKAVLAKVKERGDKAFRKFQKAVALVNKLPNSVGNAFAKAALSEIRDALFGDSIKFLITGGSGIQKSTVEFFNGIGYHLVNGYGMTELGITSVETSQSKKNISKCSIGQPIGSAEYSINDCGVLTVRAKTRAARIMQGGEILHTDFDSYFVTSDLVTCEDGRYYIHGRSDDLIILDNGENLNPEIAEETLKLPEIDRLSLFADGKGFATLIASVPACYSKEKLNAIYENLLLRISEAKLDRDIKRIYFTQESLLSGNDFKVSRTKIKKRVEEGRITLIDPKRIDERIEELLSALEGEVAECFAQALGKSKSEIRADDGFFNDLGGSSLEYFSLLSILKSRFGIEFLSDATEKLTTVKDFCEKIKK